jgi:hypothetical protein
MKRRRKRMRRLRSKSSRVSKTMTLMSATRRKLMSVARLISFKMTRLPFCASERARPIRMRRRRRRRRRRQRLRLPRHPVERRVQQRRQRRLQRLRLQPRRLLPASYRQPQNLIRLTTISLTSCLAEEKARGRWRRLLPLIIRCRHLHSRRRRKLLRPPTRCRHLRAPLRSPTISTDFSIRDL